MITSPASRVPVEDGVKSNIILPGDWETPPAREALDDGVAEKLTTELDIKNPEHSGTRPGSLAVIKENETAVPAASPDSDARVNEMVAAVSFGKTHFGPIRVSLILLSSIKSHFAAQNLKPRSSAIELMSTSGNIALDAESVIVLRPKCELSFPMLEVANEKRRRKTF